MEFLKILENIEITEEQVAALDKFFAENKKKVQDECIAKFLEEQGLKVDENGKVVYDEEKYIRREDAERAFDAFEADAERAFELFEEDAEKAFDAFEADADKAFELFEEDAEKAFDLFEEDTKKQYTENMAEALQEVYSDIEERVKNDFVESKEYKTIQKLKDLVLPLLEDEDHDLVAKIKSISEEKEKVEEENRELSKEKAINMLLKDIPREYEETIKKFISKGKDEQEVIERFNEITEAIIVKEEKKEDDIKFVRKQKQEEETVVTEEEQKEKDSQSKTGTHIFEYETVKKEKPATQNVIKAFTEEEEVMLQRAGLL